MVTELVVFDMDGTLADTSPGIIASFMEVAHQLDVPEPPPTPETVDIVPLMQIILVLLGAIVAVVGLLMRSPWLIVIGLIVAVAGYFLAGFIAGLVF